MANRFRNERLEIKLTTEEKELFKKKLEISKSKSMDILLENVCLKPLYLLLI